ncbi:gamma-mobile-trio protein GmtX [Pseudomonas koreensis]|jgi:hypothetical protein|uniref:gamma-mobile-trio protein GmtX n=1 Tax=Pseudomonas koreensis TaxID=198620 RepID=UPI0018E6A00A|nr:gamma-mobile-trio protein GmtX [Pseudomonas koreensis]MBI6949761.1 hypothetical protein [Pseudomonas koreensis]
MMEPKDVLLSLKSQCSAKVGRSLDAIFLVCEQKLNNGDLNFNYSSIARDGVVHGVPKAQSIRNKTGAIYRALIESFAIVSAETKKRNKVCTSLTDEWVSEIKDVRLRFLVQAKLAELAEVKQILLEIIPPKLEVRVDDRQGNVLTFTSSERRAIEYIISQDFISDHRFVLGAHGDVLDSEGRRVLRPGTIDALKKSLSYL